MRKIETQAEIDKRRNRNQFIVGIVLVGLIVLSTLGYSLMSGNADDEESRVKENGIDFFRQNGRWVTQINGAVFGFIYLPSEVSDINVNTSISFGEYSGQPLYFVSPNEGANEVLVNLGNYILRYQGACLENETCEGDFPIKNCDDNLIIFLSGNSNEVYQDGNCVFIVGDSLRATDAFLYKLLQII